jgi:hypothetical protein
MLPVSSSSSPGEEWEKKQSKEQKGQVIVVAQTKKIGPKLGGRSRTLENLGLETEKIHTVAVEGTFRTNQPVASSPERSKSARRYTLGEKKSHEKRSEDPATTKSVDNQMRKLLRKKKREKVEESNQGNESKEKSHPVKNRKSRSMIERGNRSRHSDNLIERTSGIASTTLKSDKPLTNDLEKNIEQEKEKIIENKEEEKIEKKREGRKLGGVEKQLREIFGSVRGRRKSKRKKLNSEEEEKLKATSDHKKKSQGNRKYDSERRSRTFDEMKVRDDEKTQEASDVEIFLWVDKPEEEVEELEENIESADTSIANIIEELEKKGEVLEKKGKKLKEFTFVQDFHQEMERVIENSSHFNLLEIAQFRSFIHKFYQDNLNRYYSKHRVLRLHFIEKSIMLFNIQETKAAEFIAKKELSEKDLEMEGLSKEDNIKRIAEQAEALHCISEYDHDQAKILCENKQNLLLSEILKCKGTYKKLIQQFAAELNLGAFALMRKLSFKNGIQEGIEPLKTRYNYLTLFMKNAMLSVKDPQARTNVYVFFLNLLDHLVHEKHDYYNGRAVADVLNDHMIERTLKREVSSEAAPLYLNDDQKNRRKALFELFSVHHGSVKLQEAQKSYGEKQTFLPDITLLKKHLISMAEGGKKLTEKEREEQRNESLIPLKKCMELSKKKNRYFWRFTDFISIETFDWKIADQLSNRLREAFLEFSQDSEKEGRINKIH